MFKTVAQSLLRTSVAHRSLKAGKRTGHTSPWSQNGYTVVGHLLPRKNAYCCEHCVSIWATLLPSLYHHCASFDRPIASIERSLWRPLCLHAATTVTLEPTWQCFCLHFASFARPVVQLQQLWLYKEDTRVVLQQLHRNRTFWVWATAERPNHFSGRSKMARRSQPYVKGASVTKNPTKTTSLLTIVEDVVKNLSVTACGQKQHQWEEMVIERLQALWKKIAIRIWSSYF